MVSRLFVRYGCVKFSHMVYLPADSCIMVVASTRDFFCGGCRGEERHMVREITIGGMGGAHCVSNIKNALSPIEDLTVDMIDIGKVIVNSSRETAFDDAVAAIKEAGYDVIKIS